MRTTSGSRRLPAITMAVLLLTTMAPSAAGADPKAIPGSSSTVAPGPAVAPPLSVESVGAPITLPRYGTIVVQTIRSIAALSIDDLALAQPTSQPLINDAAHVATTVTIGPFTAGTSLVFSLHSSFTNETYLSTDNHAIVVADGPDKWAVGWEDWVDFNYSDVTMLVCYQGTSPGCPIDPDRVLGRGSFGNTAPAQAYQAEPVNTAIGNYVTEAVDAHLPGRWMPLDFVRTYNSLSTDDGPFGPGWTHSFTARIVPNADGSATVVSEDGARTTYASDGAGGFLRPPGAYGVLTSGGGGYELLKRSQVRYQFDANGVLQTIRDRNNNTITLAYTSGQLTTITDTVGRQVALSHNPDGTLGSLGFPPSRTVLYAYYPDGHLQNVTDARGGITTYAYDAAGRLETITDQNGHDLVTNTYGTNGRVVEQVDARGFHTTFDWDPLTETSTMTDARGGEWVDDYDAGILMSQRDPLGNTTSYSFSAELGLSAVVDARGLKTETNVDASGNLTFRKSAPPFNFTESWTYRAPFGVAPTTYTYDPNNNRTQMTDSAGTSSYTYDVLNRLATYRRASRGLDYQYDAASNLTRRTYTDGTIVDLTYDNDGRMATMVSAGLTTAYGYDPAANLVTTTLPTANGYVEGRTYDRSGRLTEVKNQKGATVLSRSTYSLDPVGNRLSMQTTTGTVTYSYDVVDRLTEACYTVACAAPGDNFRRYTYDPVGNRLTEARDTGTTTATYDAADQLTGTTGPGGAVTYTYDLDGRQTAAGSRTFTWAQPDRLASTRQGNTTTTYTYDGDGLRLQASTGNQASKKTQFDWDVNRALPELVAERDGNAALVRRYRQGLATVAMDTGGSPFYYHYDGLGSVVNLTSSTGLIQWTYDYLPYGGVRTETKNQTQAPDNVVRFTGQVLDPTGLYQLRARSYDPATGRFISTDPVTAGPRYPLVAAYLYAQENPVRVTDPSGQCPWCLIGGAIGLVAYTTSVVATNVVQGNGVSLQGWDATDAAISTVAGALSGGLSAAGVSIGGQVAMNAIIGFDSSLASMATHSRSDPGELVVGTVFGAAGPLLPAGEGASGLFRGYMSSSAASTLQNVINTSVNPTYSLVSAAASGPTVK